MVLEGIPYGEGLRGSLRLLGVSDCLDNLPKFTERISQALVWLLYVHATKPDAKLGLPKTEPFTELVFVLGLFYLGFITYHDGI